MKTDGFAMPPILVYCQLIRRWNLMVCLTHHGPTFEVANTCQCQRGCQHIYSILLYIHVEIDWGPAPEGVLDQPMHCFWMFLARSSNKHSVQVWFGMIWLVWGRIPSPSKTKQEAASPGAGHRYWLDLSQYFRFTVSPPSFVFQSKWVYHTNNMIIQFLHNIRYIHIPYLPLSSANLCSSSNRNRFLGRRKSWSTTSEHKARQTRGKVIPKGIFCA